MSDLTPSHDNLNHHGNSFGDHQDSMDHHHHQPHSYNLFPDSSHGIFGNETIMHHADPLSVSHKFKMPPLKVHFVKPHLVQGYMKEDGTMVKSYIRDGEGAGYLRSNPDGILTNNLDYLLGD